MKADSQLPGGGAKMAAFQFDFRAETSLGPVRLRVPVARASGKEPHAAAYDSVDAVLALSRCEPLLRVLEVWLGMPLDVVPGHPAQPDVKGLTAVVNDGQLAEPGTTFHIGWAALHIPPPVLLRAPGVTWAVLRCELELARYEYPPADRVALRAGSVLLMPPSFEDDWHMRLVEIGKSAAVNAVYGASDDGLDLRGELQMNMRGAPSASVILDGQVNVPAEMALGWSEMRTLRLGEIGGTYNLLSGQSARLLGPDGVSLWAQGMIVPALCGAGLLIVD